LTSEPVRQGTGYQGARCGAERCPGYQVPGCEAGQMVGNKAQSRPDVGGVVPEQESADAGQYRQVPVKACRETRVQLLEDPPPGWLRCLGFRSPLAPPRGRLSTAAGELGCAQPPPLNDDRIPGERPARSRRHRLSVSIQ